MYLSVEDLNAAYSESWARVMRSRIGSRVLGTARRNVATGIAQFDRLGTHLLLQWRQDPNENMGDAINEISTRVLPDLRLVQRILAGRARPFFEGDAQIVSSWLTGRSRLLQQFNSVADPALAAELAEGLDEIEATQATGSFGGPIVAGFLATTTVGAAIAIIGVALVIAYFAGKFVIDFLKTRMSVGQRLSQALSECRESLGGALETVGPVAIAGGLGYLIYRAVKGSGRLFHDLGG